MVSYSGNSRREERECPDMDVPQYQRIDVFLGILRHLLHRICETESTATPPKVMTFKKKILFGTDFYTIMGHLSHIMSIISCNFA